MADMEGQAIAMDADFLPFNKERLLGLDCSQ